MKKLELQNFGVVEMSNVEMKKTDGGTLPSPEAVWNSVKSAGKHAFAAGAHVVSAQIIATKTVLVGGVAFWSGFLS